MWLKKNLDIAKILGFKNNQNERSEFVVQLCGKLKVKIIKHKVNNVGTFSQHILCNAVILKYTAFPTELPLKFPYRIKKNKQDQQRQ